MSDQPSVLVEATVNVAEMRRGERKLLPRDRALGLLDSGVVKVVDQLGEQPDRES